MSVKDGRTGRDNMCQQHELEKLEKLEKQVEKSIKVMIILELIARFNDTL